ncbi:MAG: hypothetical protein ABS949_06630 [Solibacillus sp.]
MKVTQMDSELYCTTCHADTVHRVTYLNRSIKKIECLDCHQHVKSQVKFKAELYTDLVDRLGTKPHRIAKELNDQTFKTICKLPFRLVEKPFHLAQEIKQSYEDYKKSKPY